MFDEREIIAVINSRIPSGPGRETTCFESDAERLDFNGSKILLTTDEFSKEDRFPETEPYLLGWNIAAGAVSDILATGGIPLYYTHALTLSRAWKKRYLERFCDGIRDILKAYQICFAGGDVGLADEFRCTVTVVGKPTNRNVSRVGAAPGDAIYISGKMGAGNYNAALTMFSEDKRFPSMTSLAVSKFAPRPREAELVRKYATACIDTSDGAFCAVSTIAQLNRVGYVIDNLPYKRAGGVAAKLMSLPAELLFFGECGEYELLFTVNPEDETHFVEEALAQQIEFFRLGQILSAGDGRTVKRKKGDIQIGESHPRARDYIDARDYLVALIDWINKHAQ